MQVTLVSSDYLPSIGGVAAHVHQLGLALRRAAIQTSVVTFGPDRFPADGLPLEAVPLLALPGERLLYWNLRRRARRMSPRSASEPWVVHVHDCDYGHYVAAHCRATVRVFTNHTSGFLQDLAEPSGRQSWRRRLEQYDLVVAPSSELLARTLELGVDQVRATYIPNGVDTSLFFPDREARLRIRRELEIEPNSVVIILPRRFVAKNGVIDFAHALRELAECADRVTILAAGNEERHEARSEYERETVSVLMSGPLASRVRLLGKVPNRDMPALYSASDAAAFPSLKEATSIAGLEAMACGLPLVSTNVGGLPDLVRDRETGYLVRPGDPTAFGEALKRLVMEPNRAAELGAKAREVAVAEFDWSRIGEQTLVAYQTALENAKRRPLSQ